MHHRQLFAYTADVIAKVLRPIVYVDLRCVILQARAEIC